MGTSPKGVTYNTDGTGAPLLNGPTEFGPVHPDCTLFTTAPVRVCEPYDLLFCVRGSTTGRMNWADRRYALGRGVAAIRGPSVLETRYVRYALEAGLPSLLARAGGGTFPNLTQGDIASFEIPWPDSRRKIGAVLAAYDELIENNLDRIRIVEEMAAALYREWFVDYRFPGHEGVAVVESPLGAIPNGWTVGPVAAHVRRLGAGRTRKPDEVAPLGRVLIVDQSRSDELHFHDDEPAVLASVRSPVATFGDHTCRMRLVVEPFSVGPNVVVFVSSDERPTSYVFRILQGLVETREYKRHWSELSAKELPWADPRLCEMYAAATDPMTAMAWHLRHQNSKLRAVRDLLLPRLVSGDLDVSNLDINMESFTT